jgi:hypothetical protein
MKNQAMDKLFAISVLSLLGLGLATDRADAFGCCCRCNGYVYGHQANAFSDYCVDGTRFKRCNLFHRCNFLPVSRMGPAPCQAPCWGMPDMCCDTGSGDRLPPAGNGPTFQAPMPTPAPTQPPQANTTGMQAWPQNYAPMPQWPQAYSQAPVQPTGYPMYYPGYSYPGYYPGYNGMPLNLRPPGY